MTELSTTLQRAKVAHKVSRKKLCDLYVSPSLIIAPILLSGTLLDFFHVSQPEAQALSASSTKTCTL